MKHNIFVRIMMGFGSGGLFTFMYLTNQIFNTRNTDDLLDIWLKSLAFMLIGFYFALSSYIYDIENWSMLKKTIIHFCLSLFAFYLITFSLGVLPIKLYSMLFNFLTFGVIYFGIWIGYKLYYKKIINEMNHLIK